MDPVLIIFIAIAGFVLYRLFSVLGARTGEERPREIEGLQRAARREQSEPVTEANRPPSPVSPAAASLQGADPDFDEASFLDGAKAAYEMIVEAFAAGDLKSIRRYMSASVYEAFRGALAAREGRKHVVDLKFVGIDRASIRSASVEAGELVAEVDFTSNQVRVTRDEHGAVVDGDPNRIDLVRDVWTFSRPVRSNDPNWTLIATGGA